MKPITVTLPPPITAPGHGLQRAWVAMVREHRLPTGLAVALERLKIRLGWRFKTVTVSGLRFRVRRLAADEHFIRDVVADEEYAAAGYQIGKQDTVVDIGGNVGSFTVYAAKRAPGGRVIVLEPASENHELLVQNVALNELHNVTIRQAALVGQGHRARIYLSDYGSGGHSIVDRLVSSRAACEDVEGVTLGDLFREYQLPQCEFLKLDCEGAEFEVLRTLDRDTARRIRRLVMEYHTFPDRDKREQAGELIDRLIELGFEIDRYTDVVGTYWGMIYARQVEDAGARICPA